MSDSKLDALKASFFGKPKPTEPKEPKDPQATEPTPSAEARPTESRQWAEFYAASSKLEAQVADDVPLFPVPERVLEAQRTDPDKWTVSWDPDGDPAHISCWTAASIAQHCITPLNRFRHLYRDGKMPQCSDKVNDVMLCLRIRAMASSDPEKAKRVLAEKHPRVPPPVVTEHVWKFRDRPPPNFCIFSIALPATTPAPSAPAESQSQST